MAQSRRGNFEEGRGRFCSRRGPTNPAPQDGLFSKGLPGPRASENRAAFTVYHRHAPCLHEVKTVRRRPGFKEHRVLIEGDAMETALPL